MMDTAADAPEPFSRTARYYDLIYRSKDYAGECELIIEAVRRFCTLHVDSLLDLGCGTGGHLAVLVGTGWRLVGIDASPSMVCAAEAKLSRHGDLVRIIRADIRDLALHEHFAVCTAMFAVLGYLVDDQDIHKALTAIHDHLYPGGLLIFDVWHGPSVLAIGPSKRTLVVRGDGVELRRTATPNIDPVRRTVSVRYDVESIDQSGVEVFSEAHAVRYFFPDEVTALLNEAGFETLRIAAFPSLDTDLDDRAWNMAVVARAR